MPICFCFVFSSVEASIGYWAVFSRCLVSPERCGVPEPSTVARSLWIPSQDLISLVYFPRSWLLKLHFLLRIIVAICFCFVLVPLWWSSLAAGYAGSCAGGCWWMYPSFRIIEGYRVHIGDCSPGPKAANNQHFGVLIPGCYICMSKYTFARYWTPSCSLMPSSECVR